MKLTVRTEVWPLAEAFAISRDTRTVADVVVVELEADGAKGWGESVPYDRYGESLAGVVAEIEAMAGPLANGLDRAALQQQIPPGAARNALDCALWDLECKQSGQRIAERAGLPPLKPVVTAYTLSLDTPEKMAAKARKYAHRKLLKCKLAGEGDLERIAAIREAAPHAKLIVDANEGWRADQVEPFAQALADLGVAMIEQPMPADQDAILADLAHPVPFCADESCHTAADLPRLIGRYEMVNIKVDKTGGLTEALKLKAAAEAAGLRIMVGCMIGTSLAMAPALCVAQGAEVVDLDGPLLMAGDRTPGLVYDPEQSLVAPPEPELWG
ncbi:MAG: N-acetyl-D-Glu racemase DgcA [Bacteroidota bacterium]